MQTIMVTGGLGYLGQQLVRSLQDKGCHVVSYNRDYSEQSGPLLSSVQGELYDIPRIVKTIQKYHVTRIIHTAAMSHPDLSIELPMTTVSANIEGTICLLEAMRLAQIKKIVLLSSETVYGHVAEAIDESSPTYPTTPYGVTKLACEHFGRVYNELYGMETVSLRVAEIYGPGNKMPQILRDILKTVLQGKAFHMDCGADHRFHFVHVEDVTQAVIQAALLDGVTASVLNIAGDCAWLLSEAATLIERIVPEANIHIGPGHWHLDRQGEWSTALAEQQLGYRAKWTLPAGLEHYAKWLSTHPY